MVPTAWEKMMPQESEKKEWYILSEWNVGFRIIVIYLKEREYNPLRVGGGGTLLILAGVGTSMCSWEPGIISQWQASQLYCVVLEHLHTSPMKDSLLLQKFQSCSWLQFSNFCGLWDTPYPGIPNLRVGNYVDLLKLPYWYWISRVLKPRILHVIVTKITKLKTPN